MQYIAVFLRTHTCSGTVTYRDTDTGTRTGGQADRQADR